MLLPVSVSVPGPPLLSPPLPVTWLLMVPLSLSYDHRVIDGAYAARFIVLLVKLLQDLRRLSL